jgi:hypothetical protein
VNNFQFIIEIWIINNSSPIPMQLSGIPKFIASLPVKDKLVVKIPACTMALGFTQPPTTMSTRRYFYE